MKIAGWQIDVELGDRSGNLDRMASRYIEACETGAELVIFPECAVTGYCFASRSVALRNAEPLDGPSVETMTRVCDEYGGAVIFGFLERDGDRLYNALAMVDGSGIVGSYRKVHLPFIGVDRFTDPGDQAFELIEWQGVKIGLNICYDSAFPESSRVLALQGADLIVLPTNWPAGAEVMAEHAINTRAMENGLYYAAVNRIGMEAGTRFIGLSSICGPAGNTLASGKGTTETMLLATVDPEQARDKLVIRKPDEHMIHRTADRRPSWYTELTRDHTLDPPGRTTLPNLPSPLRKAP